MSRQPNIIYLHSHDTGRYIQPYGHAIDTPNLQRFAEQGVLFRQAFCANPTCSPSRAALLTGSYPHNNGMLALAHRGGRLNDYNQHIAATLNNAGYHTALVGAHHVISHQGGNLTELPYQEHLKPREGPHHEVVTEAAVDFIKRDHEQPFFLACGYGLTHRTGKTTENTAWHCGTESPLGEPRYSLPPAPLPDTPETRRDFADFKVCANRLDQAMGRVIAAVDEAGLADETLIIVTTDHGIAYPFMKCNLLDHGIGIMLMMRGPGGFTGGQVVDAMVSHIDLFPTVCDTIGIARPDWLQGESVLPLVNGETQRIHDAIFAEVNFHASYEPKRCVRTERWKYIRRFETLPHPVLPNCDDSASKHLLLHHGWRERPQVEERLFDLIFDPNEACNLAGDPAYADVLTEMRGRLENWMTETDDPLLAGPIEPGPDYVIDPVDALEVK